MSVTLEMIFDEIKKINKRLETIEYLLVECEEPRRIDLKGNFRELKELINRMK